MRSPLAIVLLTLLAACSKDEAPPPAAPAHTPAELARQLDAAVAELMARPEHSDPQVTVQHVLVGVKDAGLPPSVTRTPAEAKALAADLLGRIEAGEDFDLIVKNHTDDSHPGIYTLVTAGGNPPSTWNRKEMVPAFGDVGWRLAVGEVGVAPHDPQKSPFGYHIVKRTR
jgi:hypothetical protein